MASADGRRRPIGFSDWDQERQVEHVAKTHTRVGLIYQVLAQAEYEVDREIDAKTRMQVSEIAAILLALEEDAEIGR